MADDFEGSQLVVDNFVGGPTDKPLDGAPNEYFKMDNLVFNQVGKPVTRPGSDINSDTVFQIPAGSSRIGSLFSDTSKLFVQSGRNIYIPETSSWTTLQNPNPALSTGDTTNHVSWANWSGHTFVTSDAYAKPIKIFNDSSAGMVVRTAGLPALASTPTITPVAGANNYVYAFTRSVSYQIEDLTFEDESAVVEALISSAAAPNVSPIAITNIPVLINGSTNNYDTTNGKVRIYRTINNGNVFYFVAEISNGTTSYNDTTSDATLLNSTTLYTTGDVPDNDEPPLAKYVHIMNGFAFYANVKEGIEINPHKILQSQQNDPDSVPATFFTEVNQEIVGISSYNSNPIVFAKNKIYRIKGLFDELGFGGMVAEEYSATIGATNHASIVQTKMGIFFCGNDGFYWTDGYQVQRLSDKIINTYKLLITDDDQKAAIVGTYDRINNRVLWAMHSTTAQTENDIIYALDLRWGLRENSAITTWTGTEFKPSAICFHNDTLFRGDPRGYLFFHSEDLFTDRAVDVNVTPPDWEKQAMIWNYTSTSINFGAAMVRKWVNQVLMSVKSEGNVSIQILSNNDDGSAFKELKELKDESHIVWGDPSVIWGEITNEMTGEPLWDFVRLVQQKRRFPRGGMRCNYKQIKFTNSFTNIWNSDRFEEAVVGSTTAVMPTLDWTTDVVGYYITFESDSYTAEYLITDVNDVTLTFTVGMQQTAPVTGSQKWIIKGYAKGHSLHLLGYILYFTPLSKSFQPYTTGMVGGNDA